MRESLLRYGRYAWWAFRVLVGCFVAVHCKRFRSDRVGAEAAHSLAMLHLFSLCIRVYPQAHSEKKTNVVSKRMKTEGPRDDMRNLLRPHPPFERAERESGRRAEE